MVSGCFLLLFLGYLANVEAYLVTSPCPWNYNKGTWRKEWVKSVVEFSSEYTTYDWGSVQLLGKPDVYPEEGDIPLSWSGYWMHDIDYLVLDYGRKMHISKVDVFEIHTMGGTFRISAMDDDCEWHVLWEGTPGWCQYGAQIFSPHFPPADFLTDRIRLDIDSRNCVSWYDIDAVSIAGYDDRRGPEFWADHYPECSLEAQSPIDLGGCAQYDFYMPSLQLSGYNNPEHYAVENNGRHVIMTPLGGPMTVTGGLMTDTYTLDKIRFHWGSHSNKGSEHTVNGRRYAGEVHMIHYNSDKYSCLHEAATHPDGLAIVAVFIEEGEHDNLILNDLPLALPMLHYPNHDPVILPYLNVWEFIPKACHFYTYRGSLTTPPCHQSVIWSVLSKPTYLSIPQLEALRQLLDVDGNPLVNNFRPTQPLGGRTVYKSWGS